MPRFNSRGDWCAGIGGGKVTVNGTVIATNAGQACWLDDNRVIYQQDAHLETYRVSTGAYVRDFDPLGADAIAAGAGVYIVRFNGVVRSGTNDTWPGMFVGDVGPDGAILLVNPDGTFKGRVVRFLQSLGGASWSGLEEYRPVQSPDLQVPQILAGRVFGFRRFGRFCCYLAEDGSRLVVQYLDRPVGKVLAVTDKANRPDLVQIGNELHVIYSVDEGEAVTVRLPPVPIAALTEPLISTVKPPVVTVPPVIPIPQPKPEPKPMPVPDRSAFAASFLGPRLALVGSMDETRAHTFAAVKDGCVELRKSDTRWGLLAKPSGDNVDGFAADIWLYDLADGTAQVVDVVNNGEGAPNDQGVRTPPSPGWSVKDIRPIAQWKAPAGGAAPGTPAQPPAAVSPGAALDEQIRSLRADCDALRARLAAVEARPSGGGTVSLAGLRVALRTDNGHYLTADEGGGKVPFDRPAVGGGWEIFTVEPQ